jgi:hypothetical protein
MKFLRVKTTLPRTVGKDLRMNKITSAKNIIFPENVGGNLTLYGLTDIKDFNPPTSVGGKVELKGISDPDQQELTNKFPNLNFDFT